MFKKVKAYIWITLIVFVGLIFAFELWHINVAEVPLHLYSEGDGIWNIARQQILIEEKGIGYSSLRMGFPLGHESYDFSTGSLLPLLWQKVWALVTDNAILGLNLAYLFGFLLIAWIAFYVLTKLAVEDNIAIVLSCLYAFLPYHIYRGTMHSALSFYVVVPIACYYVLRFMESSEADRQVKPKQVLVWILMMLLLGMDGVYYAFFSCVFLGVALLYNFINKRGARNIIGCLLSIVLVVAGLLVSALPNILYWMKNGTAGDTIVRQLQDVPQYALRIVQLILPTVEHRFSLFAGIQERYSGMVPANENVSVALGLIFSIGYLALWLSILKKEQREADSVWHSLVTLTICGTLYATVGGLIEAQGLLFTIIRCSNRICVFLAFFACVAVAKLLQRIWERYSLVRTKRAVLILLGILCVGIFDQTPQIDAEEYYNNQYDINCVKEFVQEIEKAEPDIAILQFPYSVYPEGGQMENMKGYSHSLLFACSDSLKWSYGAMRGRAADSVLYNLYQLDLPDMLEKAAQIGFGGICIDRWGYSQAYTEQLEWEIEALINREPIVSCDGRYVFYSLKKYIADNSVEYEPEVMDSLLYKITNGKNMYQSETDHIAYWFWAQNDSELTILNHTGEASNKLLTFEVRYYNAAASESIYVSGTDFTDEIDMKQGLGTYTKEITLQPGENVIRLTTEEQNEEVENGAREICFMVLNSRLSDVSDVSGE